MAPLGSCCWFLGWEDLFSNRVCGCVDGGSWAELKGNFGIPWELYAIRRAFWACPSEQLYALLLSRSGAFVALIYKLWLQHLLSAGLSSFETKGCLFFFFFKWTSFCCLISIQRCIYLAMNTSSLLSPKRIDFQKLNFCLFPSFSVVKY